MDIGKNIKTMRKALNMEQSELAKRLNVSNKTISSWECGRTEPKMDMIEKLSVIFGLKKSELLEENFSPYRSFDSGAEFEKAWKDSGGRHPIDLTDDEYSMIIDIRTCDDKEFQSIKRFIAYTLTLRGLEK